MCIKPPKCGTKDRIYDAKVLNVVQSAEIWPKYPKYAL